MASSGMPENVSEAVSSSKPYIMPSGISSDGSSELSLRGGGPTQPLGDDERAPAMLWWLAGGMGQPPTGAQLRASKKARRARRESGGGCGLCAAIFGRRNQEE